MTWKIVNPFFGLSSFWFILILDACLLNNLVLISTSSLVKHLHLKILRGLFMGI
jgi:hypothetical protein